LSWVNNRPWQTVENKATCIGDDRRLSYSDKDRAS
jgi:hypothetical protein